MRIQARGFIFLALFLCPHFHVFAQEFSSHAPPEPVETLKEAIEQLGETHGFQAEIGRLMDIIVNSLYTNKEVFLREVISNASDALDKIRFLSVADADILGKLSELVIRIAYDKEEKTISIYDSGIGMTKQDLINNLGTIAKSGTTNFVEALTKGQSLNLIGQFGVGFYSTFLAGNKVTVITKHNDDEQYIWESSSAHSFTVKKDTLSGEKLERGTKIIIHLKQDAQEFCDEAQLRSLIQKYSEFINFPIYLRVQKEISKEVTEEEEEPSAETEKAEKKDDLEVKDEDEEKKPKTKTVTEKVWDWELVNEAKAIWLRNKEDLTEEDYNNFYKAVSRDYDSPLAHIHFNAEGEVEFKSILFVPGHAPSDMYEHYYAKVSSLKLYVRRVLVNEKFEDLLPKYLNFIRGVIDSDDLPINVSRESLQQLKMLKVMGKKLVKKALEMIKKLADAKEESEEDEEYEDDSEEDVEDKTDQDRKEDTTSDEDHEEKEKERERKRQERIEKYNTFWREFGKNIKLGIIEDAANKNRLAQLSRWYTSTNLTTLTSFDDYLSRMKPNQDHIYYIGGESKEVLMKHPALQKLLKGGIEVILLDDPVDEFCIEKIYDYEKKTLVNVAKGTFIMPTGDELAKKKLTKLKKMYSPLTDWWKNLLKENLDEVTVSERLVEDPCIIVGSVFGQSPNMERIQRAQAYGPQNPMTSSKRKLEINPGHPVIKELLERVKDTADQETEELATLLYEAALLNSGYSLADPREFFTKFVKIFNPLMNIPKDAKAEEIEVELDDEDIQTTEPITPVKGTSGDHIHEEIGPDSINIKFDEPAGKKDKDYRASRDSHETIETPKEEARETADSEDRETYRHHTTEKTETREEDTRSETKEEDTKTETQHTTEAHTHEPTDSENKKDRKKYDDKDL